MNELELLPDEEIEQLMWDMTHDRYLRQADSVRIRKPPVYVRRKGMAISFEDTQTFFVVTREELFNELPRRRGILEVREVLERELNAQAESKPRKRL